MKKKKNLFLRLQELVYPIPYILYVIYIFFVVVFLLLSLFLFGFFDRFLATVVAVGIYT